jgi:hypothetical protein
MSGHVLTIFNLLISKTKMVHVQGLFYFCNIQTWSHSGECCQHQNSLIEMTCTGTGDGQSKEIIYYYLSIILAAISVTHILQYIFWLLQQLLEKTLSVANV